MSGDRSWLFTGQSLPVKKCLPPGVFCAEKFGEKKKKKIRRKEKDRKTGERGKDRISGERKKIKIRRKEKDKKSGERKKIEKSGERKKMIDKYFYFFYHE